MIRKKKSFFLLFMILLLTFISGQAFAKDYGRFYDGSNAIDEDYGADLSQKLDEYTEKYEVDLHIDIVYDLEGDTLESWASSFYDQYEYGYPGTEDGLLLMLLIEPNGDGFAFGDYYMIYGGEHEDELYDLTLNCLDVIDEWYDSSLWENGAKRDQNHFESMIEDYLETIEKALSSEDSGIATSPASIEPEDNSDAGTEEESDSGWISRREELFPDLGGTPYVADLAGILSNSEKRDLNDFAEELVEEYECGVYIVTVEDFEDYARNRSVSYAHEVIFDGFDFGVGEDRDSISLLLSMNDRDFDIDAYGFGNTAFTDYGKQQMQDDFLVFFRENDWYGGFESYLSTCEYYLKRAREGNPFDIQDSPGYKGMGILASLALGLAAAGILHMVLKGNMGKPEARKNAKDYVVPESLNIRTRTDNYTNTTRTRRYSPPPKDSGGGGGGGTSVNSSGHSHSSGKF